MVKDYTIGIYIRLSMADEDTGTGNKAEKATASEISVCSSTATLTTIRHSPNIRGLSSRMMDIPVRIFTGLSLPR